MTVSTSKLPPPVKQGITLPPAPIGQGVTSDGAGQRLAQAWAAWFQQIADRLVSSASQTNTDIKVVHDAVPLAATEVPLVDGVGEVGTSEAFAREDHQHPTDASRAPVVSPTLTGAGTRVNANASVTPPAGPAGTVLQVVGVDGTGPRSVLDGFGAGGVVAVRRADGTAAVPTALQANEAIGGVAAYGYAPAGYSTGARGSINFVASAMWTNTSTPVHVTFSTTPVGAVAQAERMRLQNSGALTIGTAVDDGVNLLQVNGGAKATKYTIGPGGISFSAGSGAPSAVEPVGSWYADVGGAVGSTIYFSRGGGVWNALPGV